jgi:hypothetical protein
MVSPEESFKSAKDAVKSAAAWTLWAIVTCLGGPLMLITPFVSIYSTLKTVRAISKSLDAWHASGDGARSGLWLTLAFIVLLGNLGLLVVVGGVLTWISAGGLPY